MSDYDNTNRGAVFQPFEDQNFVLQGKLNLNGKEYPVVVMKMQSKNGNTRLEIYQKMGAMFEEKEKTNDKAPDYTGPMDLIEGNLRLAGWREQKDGKPYMSLQASEAQAKTEQAPAVTGEVVNDIDDVIPF